MSEYVYPPCFEIPNPCNCSGVDFDTVDQSIIDRVKKGVGEMFYSATHGKYSCCESRVYPCIQDMTCDSSNIEWLLPYSIPYLNLDTGIIKNCMPCRCKKTSCECTEYPYVLLPSSATEITGVWIGGINVYSTTSFWFHNDLLYTSLPDGFPKCNSLNPNDADSWYITFRQGIQPPQYALDLLSDIVCERVKKCLGKPCSPGPSTSRVVESNGIPFVIDDTKLVWKHGLTGYKLLDDWIMLDRGGADRAYLFPSGVRSGDRRKAWL